MAERPVFVPAPDQPDLVKEVLVGLTWNAGFAPVQKKKNIEALHRAASEAGYAPLLEISTKSDAKLGRHLSAFHLKVRMGAATIPLESAFQGSKIFEHGGPYADLYEVDAIAAKRDPRLRNSGGLVAFEFSGTRFPLEPKTVFYDWLYINSIFEHRDWLRGRLPKYAGFTDIEFNPARSINCQARSCALFVALMSKDLLEKAVESPRAFVTLVGMHLDISRQAQEKTRDPLLTE